MALNVSLSTTFSCETLGRMNFGSREQEVRYDLPALLKGLAKELNIPINRLIRS